MDVDSQLCRHEADGTLVRETAIELCKDLASRLSSRVQVTTDGLKAYIDAIEGAFGCEADYSQLVNLCGFNRTPEKRYNPAHCVGYRREGNMGMPDAVHESTSYVERQNFTTRTSMRRFTRLTNAFSRELEKHSAAINLHFVYYNFGWVRQTLRCTPAMRAEVTDHI